MDLRTVLSVSGKPGLFKLIAHQKNGVVVESLLDGKRTAISANANVSSLGDIAIYTYEEEVPLRDVFKAMAEVTEGKEALSHKSSKDQLEDFFGMDQPTDVKTASLAIIANAIMNLDEFLTHG